MDIEYLKKRKKELGMSFDELVEKSGIPKTTLTNIFGGHTISPRIDTMQAINKALGLYTSPQIKKDPVIEDEVELNDIRPSVSRADYFLLSLCVKILYKTTKINKSIMLSMCTTSFGRSAHGSLILREETRLLFRDGFFFLRGDLAPFHKALLFVGFGVQFFHLAHAAHIPAAYHAPHSRTENDHDLDETGHHRRERRVGHDIERH